MKVLFIYPDLLNFYPNYPGHYYEGIGSLSATVKACGHEAALIHITRPITDKKSFIQNVWQHEPDLIAFSATTLQFNIVKEIALWLKNDRPVPKICGGVHPSLMPEKTLLNTDIEMVCIGEGEEALGELCSRIEKEESFHDIPNIWVKNQQKIHKNPVLPPKNNLNGLPFPDRSVFDYQNLWWERKGTATLMASRGCPFVCAYCCNSALRKIYDKAPSSCRKRSVDGVIKEIQQIQKDYPFVSSLNFDDDIFFIDKKWAREFTAQYTKKINLPYFCNIRPNIVDEEIVHLLKESGCSEIRIGLESGNDEIRNSILKREISREQIVNAVRLLRNANISVRTFNIIGIPEENPRMILETIRLNAELEIADPQYTIFCPFPGTALHEKYLQRGFIQSKTMTNYYEESVMNLPELSQEHLQMFRVYFHHILKLYRILLKSPILVRSPLIMAIEAFFSSRKAPVIIRKLHLVKNRLRSKRRITEQ
jgi:radical SAM superfamily enzyme YgiQ (UPF0313 family)